jgi:DNA adenine methylase
MRPFLKWAGGKYRLVERIKAQLPAGRRLLEPFAGSCALALNTEYASYWLNDINPDLIHLYQTLQREGEAFIAACRSYFTAANNQPERYYQLRQAFNAERDPAVRAALFVYLNRHGYNGLCRYNAGGEFNVPFGRYQKPYFPEAELRYFYEQFGQARFSCIDFEEMMRAAEPGDVIYCDPPYVPLTRTSNFTAYSSGGFGAADQTRLAETAAAMARRGIVTLISNHYNEFIATIYRGARIETFAVQRFISCNGDNRNAVPEVLAVFE